MINTISDLFKDRIVTIEMVGGIEGYPPIFFTFDIKKLRDYLSIAISNQDNSGIAESVLGWSGVNNTTVLYLGSIFITSPEILPDSKDDWEFDIEDCRFIFSNMDNRVLGNFINRVEDELNKFSEFQKSINSTIDVFIKYETSKLTPKACQCDNTKAIAFGSDDEVMECSCCFHLAQSGEWDKEHCVDGCLFKKFPLWCWGLWELAALCMVRVASFDNITTEIGIDKFNRFVRKTGIHDEDKQDEIYELIRMMLYRWDDLRRGSVLLSTKEVDFIKNIKNGKHKEN